MKRHFFFSILAMLTLALLPSCEKQSGGDTPAPTTKDIVIRFRTTQGLLDVADVKFLGKYNGSSDFTELSDVKVVPYDETLDWKAKSSLAFADPEAVMVVYQTTVKLQNGTHYFKTNFTRNSTPSTAEEVTIMNYISSHGDYTGGGIVSYISGAPMANLQNWLDKYINSEEMRVGIQ